ncbi:MAG: FISUMP domain-containing protein [Bacteroidales bacterium]
MKKFLLITWFCMLVFSCFSQKTGQLVDKRDGKIYRTVKIGNQWWMAQNMACNTGNCYPYNNDESNLPAYGYYYKWSSAKDACPAGWHLPNMEDWTILRDYLGGDNGSGGKMKSLEGWDSPNKGATNESGFNGMAGGDGNSQTMKFYSMGRYGNFWSAKPYGNNKAQYYFLSFEYDVLYETAIDPNTALLNVRCVKN